MSAQTFSGNRYTQVGFTNAKIIFFLALAALLSSVATLIAEGFEDAGANQIYVIETVEIDQQPENIIPMALSSDEARLYYQLYDAKTKTSYLVVRDLASLKVIRKVRLPIEVSALAPSPDETKLAYSYNQEFRQKYAILDLRTNKAIPFEASMIGPQRLVWYAPETLVALDSVQVFDEPGRRSGGRGAYTIDLNTLAVKEQLDSSMQHLWVPERLSTHARVYLTLERRDFLTNSAVLVLTDRVTHFSREIAALSRLDSLLVARNMRFAILARHYAGSTSPTKLQLLRLGVHATPTLSFEARWEEADSIGIGKIKSYLSRGVAVFAQAYAPQKNPLNGRTIGKSALKGQVQIASLNDSTLVVTTVYEKTPLIEGDVVCDFSTPRDQGGHGLTLGCSSIWAIVTKRDNQGQSRNAPPPDSMNGQNYIQDLLAKAEVTAKAGNFRGAIETYDELLSGRFKTTSSQKVAATYKRGEAKFALGAFEKAIDDYTLTLELISSEESASKERAQVYWDRGVANQNVGRWVEAIADYTKSIENYPEFARAYNNRAFAYYKVERYQEAIGDANKYLTLDASWPGAYHIRGLAKVALRDPTGIQDLQTAARMGHQEAKEALDRAGVKY
jgi:hypothetical protein